VQERLNPREASILAALAHQSQSGKANAAVSRLASRLQSHMAKQVAAALDVQSVTLKGSSKRRARKLKRSKAAAVAKDLINWTKH
jgi:sirohydrochlorin ferrochelatase